MQIFTKWISYNGQVGITEQGEYYELATGIKLHRVYHEGAIYYRSHGSKKRYSYKKANDTKIRSKKLIIIIPF